MLRVEPLPMTMLPVKVLTPDSDKTPGPAIVMPAEPLIGAEMVEAPLT